MRHCLIYALVALLAPALLACDERSYFRFVTPSGEVAVPSGAVAFEMRVPVGTDPAQVRISMDGNELAGVPMSVSGATLTGSVAGVAPGAHELSAELLSVVATVPSSNLFARRSFETGALPSFAVNGSVRQLHLTGAAPEVAMSLRDARGVEVATGTTDYQGSLVFFEVEPGAGYSVHAATSPVEVAGPVEVLSIAGSLPPQSFYANQVLEEGFGYLTTRDGVKLSINVTLPGPLEDGPYPTVVNVSGYDPSQPSSPLLPPDDPFFNILNGLCNLDPGKDPLDILCNAPTHPTGLIAGFTGYATVGVNLRGTGCSGGAFDFYDTLQILDGYDIVETVAAQPWVRGNRVGLVGLSYPGITTLFIAKTQPPSLAAITPLSVIANTVTSTLSPGGIFNNGFALEWGTQIVNRAAPYGRGWEAERVAGGDTTCEENQLLHSQKVDIIEKARSSIYYPPELADPVAPELFAGEITVPVFTTGAWQDEQTGGHFPAMWDDYTSAPIVRRQAFNGAHADGLGPHTLVEWKLFLDFYVAEERLPLTPEVVGLAPLLFEQFFNGPAQLPRERVDEFAAYATFEEALAAYEAEEPVRILFESGGPAPVRTPLQSFDARFPSWPPPDTEARRLYLHADGSLRDFTPSEASSASLFEHDAAKGQETLITLNGGPAPSDFFWAPWQAGRQAVFLGEPLAEDLVMVGHASADLYVRGGVPEAELEVMLSEVRPDGQEVLVQSGWLRATQRALAADTTELRPIHTHLEEDAAPLSTSDFELVRVEIFPFGHVFRTGSRIRMSVASPGGNRARWRFETTEYPFAVEHAIGHDAAHPSSLVLPVIPGLTPPAEATLPPCTLRAQPCRSYVPHSNTLE